MISGKLVQQKIMCTKWLARHVHQHYAQCRWALSGKAFFTQNLVGCGSAFLSSTFFKWASLRVSAKRLRLKRQERKAALVGLCKNTEKIAWRVLDQPCFCCCCCNDICLFLNVAAFSSNYRYFERGERVERGVRKGGESDSRVRTQNDRERNLRQ